MNSSHWLTAFKSRLASGFKSRRTTRGAGQRKALSRRGPVARSERLEERALLSTITVTSLGDNQFEDGLVTLREAILAANLDLSVDGSEAGGHADTIVFDRELFRDGPIFESQTIAIDGFAVNDVGASAFVIESDVTIQGPLGDYGLTFMRASMGEFRFFEVTADGALTLENITLYGGAAHGGNGGNGTYGGGGGAGLGGAIFSRGQLTVNRSAILGNTAQGGDGGVGFGGQVGGGGGGGMSGSGGDSGGNDGGDGGGISGGSGGFESAINGGNGGSGGGGGGAYVGGSGGSGGFGAGGGGAGYLASLANNGGSGGFGGGAGAAFFASVAGFGGGLNGYDDGGTFITSPSGGGGAGLGGAIFAEGGSVTIINSTFNSNSAIGGYGGDGVGGNAAKGSGFGGHVFVNDAAKLEVVSSTFGSATAEDGAAIYVRATSTVDPTQLFIAASSLHSGDDGQNDLVVSHEDVGSIESLYPSTSEFPVIGNSLSLTNSYLGEAIDDSLNSVTETVMLGDLDGYGGPTPTFLPYLDPFGFEPNPLLNNMPFALAGYVTMMTGGVDQRGYLRPMGEYIDIGSTELEGAATYIDRYNWGSMGGSGMTGAGLPVYVFEGHDRMLVVAVTSASSATPTVTYGGFVSFTLAGSASGTNANTTLWYLPLGSHQYGSSGYVDISFPGTTDFYASVDFYTGVAQEISNVVTTTGESGTIEATAADLVLDVHGQASSTHYPTAGTGQSVRALTHDIGSSSLDFTVSSLPGNGTTSFTTTSDTNITPAHLAAVLAYQTPDVLHPRPTVLRSNPANASTNTNSVQFLVGFNEEVTGLIADVFALTGSASLNGGAEITNISIFGSTAVIDVAVDPLAEGSLSVDFVSSHDIEDLARNRLSGDFTIHDFYEIDRTAPTMTVDLNDVGATALRLSGQLNEPGQVYFAIMPDGSETLTAAELRNSMFSGPINRGIADIRTENGIEYSILGGLSEGTTYRIDAVAVDGAGNETDVMSTSFTTGIGQIFIGQEGSGLGVLDSIGGASNERLTVSYDAAAQQLVFSDPDNPIISNVPGSFGSGLHTVRVSVAGITQLVIQTYEGSDLVRFEGTLPQLVDGITVNAGLVDVAEDIVNVLGALDGGAGGISITSSGVFVSGSLTTSGSGKIEVSGSQIVEVGPESFDDPATLISTGSGGATFTTHRSLTLLNHVNLTATDNGAIVFESDGQAETDNYDGVKVFNARLNANAGAITLRGTGGDIVDTAKNYGVSVVESALTATGTASWHLDGTAKDVAGADGVRIEGLSDITSESGPITIEGTAANGDGVAILDSVVKSQDVGQTPSGHVTITGTTTGMNSSGVHVSDEADYAERSLGVIGGELIVTGKSALGTGVFIEQGVVIGPVGEGLSHGRLELNGTSSDVGVGVDLSGSIYSQGRFDVRIEGTGNAVEVGHGIDISGEVEVGDGSGADLYAYSDAADALLLDNADFRLYGESSLALIGHAQDSSFNDIRSNNTTYIEGTDQDGPVGNVLLSGDRMQLANVVTDSAIQFSNLKLLHIATNNAASSIGIGDVSGTLNLSQEELHGIKNTVDKVVIGYSQISTGIVRVSNAVFATDVELNGGDILVANLDVGPHVAILTANTGVIQHLEFSSSPVDVRATAVGVRAPQGTGNGHLRLDTDFVAAFADDGNLNLLFNGPVVVTSVGDISGITLANTDAFDGQLEISLMANGVIDVAAPITNNDKGLVSVVSFNELAQKVEQSLSSTQGLSPGAPYQFVFSPDGRHAYALMPDGETLAIFEPDSDTGALTLLGQVKQSDAGDAALYIASDIAFSPDGTFLYVAGLYGSAVSSYARNPLTGLLTHVSTLNNDGANQLLFPAQIEISPDGSKLYVLRSVSTVQVIDLDPNTGSMSLGSAFPVYQGDYIYIETMKLSPDGNQLYFTITELDEVRVMTRDPGTGDFTLTQTITNTSLNAGFDVFGNPNWMELSPDGVNLYVSNSQNDSVTIFERDLQTGYLTYRSSNREVGKTPQQLMVTPDGRQVWVVSRDHQSLKVLERDLNTGDLTLKDDRTDFPLTDYSGLGLAVVSSLDGKHVYAGNPANDTLYIYERTLNQTVIDYGYDPEAPATAAIYWDSTISTHDAVVEIYSSGDIYLNLSEYTLESVEAFVEAQGDIHQTGGIAMSAQALTLTSGGDLRLNSVSTYFGQLSLQSRYGEILDEAQVGVSISAPSAVLRAKTGIGNGNPLQTTAGNIAAETESGDIRLSYPSGAYVPTISTVDGVVGLTILDAADDNTGDETISIASFGAVRIDAPIRNYDEGLIEIGAVLDLELNSDLFADTVALESQQGRIVDVRDGAQDDANDITAHHTLMFAANGISTGDQYLEVATDTLMALTKIGDISIHNSRATELVETNPLGSVAIVDPDEVGSPNNIIRIQSDGDLTVTSKVTSAVGGLILLTSKGAFDVNAPITGGNVDLSGKSLTIDANITASGDYIQLIGDESTQISASVSGGAEGIAIVTDSIDITETGSISSNGILQIAPKSVGVEMGVATYDSGLNLDPAELSRLQDGFSNLVFGTSGIYSNTIRMGEHTFTDPVFVVASSGGGEISIVGNLSNTGGGFTFNSGDNPIELQANVSTNSEDIVFDGNVLVSSIPNVNTTASGSGADVRFVRDVSGLVSGPNGALYVNAGTGNITFEESINANGALSDLRVTAANDVLVTAPKFTIQYGPFVINASGTVTYAGDASWTSTDPNAASTELFLITNIGTAAIAGAFSNLAEGTQVPFDHFTGTLTYSLNGGNDVVLTTGGVLYVRGGDSANHFTVIRTQGTFIEVHMDGEFYAQDNESQVTSIVLRGQGNDDLLTIDYSDGFFTSTINFDGGESGANGNLIEFTEFTADAVVRSFETSTSGVMSLLSGGKSQSVHYLNVAPFSDTLNAADRQFQFPSSNDAITLIDDGALGMRVNSLISPNIDFKLPTGSLSINSGNGNDTVTAQSVDPLYVGTITVNGSEGADVLDATLSIKAVTLLGGTGNDTLTGSNLADSLAGGDDSDTIFGRNAVDTIEGGLGVDSIVAGNGDDQILWTSGDGNDAINGNVGNDTLTIFANDSTEIPDNITIHDSGIRVTASGQANGNESSFALDLGTVEIITVQLRAGNDIVDASSLTLAALVLDGGSGDDSLTGGSAADVLIGGDGADSIHGGDGNDSILGGADADTLFGDAGNDRVRGQGATGDRILGGAGNDTLDGGEGYDIVVESANQNFVPTNTGMTAGITGTDTFESIEGLDFTGGTIGNLMDASGFTLGGVTMSGAGGNDTMIGTAYTDSLMGDDGDDVMEGRDGQDFLRGFAGNDSIVCGNGNDLGVGGAGRDTILGGEGDDRLQGQGSSFDSIDGGSGNDIVSGGTGDDYVAGGDDNDRILWADGDGNDLTNGGLGNDRIVFTLSNVGSQGDNVTLQDSKGHVSVQRTASSKIEAFTQDLAGIEIIELNSLAGADVINASNLTLAALRVRSGSGNDTLIGSSLNDVLIGGIGDDSISGGNGNDTIQGQAGSDVVNGNLGADNIDVREDLSGPDGIDTVTHDVLDQVFIDLNDLFV